MRLYIAAHHPDLANSLEDSLVAAGYEVSSTWHRETGPRPGPDDREEWAAKASANFKKIDGSDALVLIAGPEKYAGGKFVEAGYAMRSLIPVFVLGRVENGMLHGWRVFHCNNEADLMGKIAVESSV